MSEMNLYSAYNVISIKQKVNHQGVIPLWIDIYLIIASNRANAYKRAEKIGKEDALLDDGLLLEDKPAKRTFEGTIFLSEPDFTVEETINIIGSLSRPVEVAYLQLEVKSDQDIKDLFNNPEKLVKIVF